MFDNIIGQEQVKTSLGAMIGSDTLPHALLFAGPYGVGKGEMALALAAKLLCGHGPESACTECGGCRRAMKLEHPDLHLLFPFRSPPESGERRGQWAEELIAHRTRLRDEAYAPVVYEQARVIVRPMVNEVHDRLLEGSFEGGRRVCVILLAEKMHPATANSILKILEEPPSGVHFILTAERLSDVLPTITSRCAVLRFRRLTVDEIATNLAASGTITGDTAMSCARVAGGSLKTAKALAFDGKSGTLAEARALYDRIAAGSPDRIIEAAYLFLRSRDAVAAEELMNGFIQETASKLEHACGFIRDGGDAAPAEPVSLRRIDRLARIFEEGLEMLGRNVAVPTVLTSTFYGIHETYNHA